MIKGLLGQRFLTKTLKLTTLPTVAASIAPASLIRFCGHTHGNKSLNLSGSIILSAFSGISD